MRIRNSVIWAILITVGVVGWISSGQLLRQSPDGTSDSAGDKQVNETLQAVRVHISLAESHQSYLLIRGLSEADQRVELRAETAGRVISTPHLKGSDVPSGSVLCQIDMGERQAQLVEARAAVDQAKLNYDASVSLMKKGFSAANETAARKARLDASMAALNRAEIDIDRTRTLAPFDGILEERNAKVGVWISIGEICAMLVDLDPILIVGQVSERDVGKLNLGMFATAKLMTGEVVEGKIGYIAASADTATRTFRVEVHVANPDHKSRAGVTAQIKVPLSDTKAHRFTPALLALDDAGRIGVRVIDDNDIVHFQPINIIADGIDGIWVSGLPSKVRVITVGQEYVRDGEKVSTIIGETDAAGF